MVKISVIIPLYNASSYLHHSIDSLLSQPFQDIEIILVDDGSTDGSAAICDEYAKKDSRISVFTNLILAWLILVRLVLNMLQVITFFM